MTQTLISKAPANQDCNLLQTCVAFVACGYNNCQLFSFVMSASLGQTEPRVQQITMLSPAGGRTSIMWKRKGLWSQIGNSISALAMPLATNYLPTLPQLPALHLRWELSSLQSCFWRGDKIKHANSLVQNECSNWPAVWFHEIPGHQHQNLWRNPSPTEGFNKFLWWSGLTTKRQTAAVTLQCHWDHRHMQP